MKPDPKTPESDLLTDRKAWMGLLAKAPWRELEALWQGFGAAPSPKILRAPEIGAVMVRGRAGATGAAFNLGEMTVTRCSVQVEGGPVGHGYVQGRSKAHAQVAATIDALMQTDLAADLSAKILTPLATEMTARRRQRAAKAAATKVDFFTMARGED